MTLGKLIELLEGRRPETPVVFDNGRVPECFCSWRGRYDELTLDSHLPGASRYDGQPELLDTVGKLLEAALKADGETFEGYKGGDFRMSRETPVWADEYGRCQCFGIMDAQLHDDPPCMVLVTAHLEDYV